ncbi:isoprenylcysteine carboxylmethyltransferase family protein [Granulicella sp. S190]|uniref:methyltransferase family protein n=1 Tax=Granulicella sp. S190 TaxID=1747226 RepID=UPI00131D6A0C|nr:isoprenylcysteine carboxylmethyltransferase family protein [Granulicella sp. S190]
MSLSKLYVVLYWIWVSSELLLQVVTRTSRRSGTVQDRGSLPLLLIAIFGSIWAAMWCSSLQTYAMPDGAHWSRVAALVLMLAGLAIRWTAVLTLGLSFSTNVAIHSTQTLRTTGLFRWARHPSYTGMLLIFAAIGIFERNWISLAIMLVFPTAALIYRIHVEEIALTKAFGATYVEYSSKTSRLLPGIY